MPESNSNNPYDCLPVWARFVYGVLLLIAAGLVFRFLVMPSKHSLVVPDVAVADTPEQPKAAKKAEGNRYLRLPKLSKETLKEMDAGIDPAVLKREHEERVRNFNRKWNPTELDVLLNHPVYGEVNRDIYERMKAQFPPEKIEEKIRETDALLRYQGIR